MEHEIIKRNIIESEDKKIFNNYVIVLHQMLCKIKHSIDLFKQMSRDMTEFENTLSELCDCSGDLFSIIQEENDSDYMYERTKESFIYYLLNEEKDKVKIGKANNPMYRAKQLQTASGEALELLHTVKFDSESHALEAELFLHTMFSNYRKQSKLTKTIEWFDACIVKELKQYYWNAEDIDSAIDNHRQCATNEMSKMRLNI